MALRLQQVWKTAALKVTKEVNVFSGYNFGGSSAPSLTIGGTNVTVLVTNTVSAPSTSSATNTDTNTNTVTAGRRMTMFENQLPKMFIEFAMKSIKFLIRNFLLSTV